MRWFSGFFALILATTAWSGEDGAAMKLSVVEPTFLEPTVVVAMSMPPQFEVVFVREMPSPGWSFTVDAVEVDEDSGRITARISDIPPEGATAQVITATKCRVPLGKLARGAYSLDLWLRRGAAGAHVLTQSLVVRAR